MKENDDDLEVSNDKKSEENSKSNNINNSEQKKDETEINNNNDKKNNKTEVNNINNININNVEQNHDEKNIEEKINNKEINNINNNESKSIENENNQNNSNLNNIEDKNKENESNNFLICHDKTINEVSDKKWNRYLIPYKTILETKRQIKIRKANKNFKDNENIDILDINNKNCNIPSKILEEYNENNLTYHWLQIPDVNNKIILVKKEHLLMQKMTNEEKEILDYNGKKYKIIPGKVCRIAKKYHITTGSGEENILYLIKDSSGNFHFVTKTIIKFAKTKRTLNDEMHTLEITDKDNIIINVNSDTIRDLEDFNPYSEWCEIENINKNKIIVKKGNLLECKEIFDKNIDGGNEIQKINDWKFDLYDTNINVQYSKCFPEKYFYLSNINRHEEFSEIKDINNKKIYIRTSLIEHYLSENINDLSLYEEVYDKNNEKQIINPYQIIKNILLSYDDIADSNGPFVQIVTQSGSKHIIKVNTINKILKIAEEKETKNNDSKTSNINNKVSIKDSNGIKIYTTLNKIKRIDLQNDNILLLCLTDIHGENCFFKKKDILNKVNDLLMNLMNDEYIILDDINGIERNIRHSQIKIINNKLKKNLIIKK